MTYSDLLKDPRWQKKRLEVLNRDNFTCLLCKDSTSTLHVHHKFYQYGKNPWEYDEKYLMTLCYSCHEIEEVSIKEYSKLLIDTLKKSQFSSDDWREIAYAIEYANLKYKSDVVSILITQLLLHPELQELLFKIIKSKKNG